MPTQVLKKRLRKTFLIIFFFIFVPAPYLLASGKVENKQEELTPSRENYQMSNLCRVSQKKENLQSEDKSAFKKYYSQIDDRIKRYKHETNEILRVEGEELTIISDIKYQSIVDDH